MDYAYQRVANRYCCVEYCPNTLRNCNQTFFRIPEQRHPEKAKKWLSALKFKPDLPKLKWICSDHFELKYFTSTLKKRLIFGAVPTLQRKIPENNEFRAGQSDKIRVVGSNNENTCAREWMIEENSNESIASKMFPVLNNERYFINKQEFINDIVEDYLHKRYANNAKQVKRKYLDSEMNSLKKLVLTENNLGKIAASEVSEFPSDDSNGFDDESDDRNIIAELVYDPSAFTRHSKKVVETSSDQDCRPLKNSIQFENGAKRNCMSSKHPVLSEKVTEIPSEQEFLLQESMSNVQQYMPTKAAVQPERVTKTANPQKSVPSKLPTETENVIKVTNPQKSASTNSLTDTENATKITHPQNPTSSKPQMLPENVASVSSLLSCDTCVSALQLKITNESFENPKSVLAEYEEDIFYKIGFAIAGDFKKIKSPEIRVKALKKIQEILSEAKSCDSNGVAF